MVAIWINRRKYIRFEGLKLKMNFVKNFGPDPTSIVVELQKINKKLVPKKTQTRTNFNSGDLDEIKRNVVTLEKIRRERMNKWR